ncbi:hypothetical protein CONCODRAFT_17304 [Conidiobolus coronatus NRRL 28638]|uniref:RRM domain-containing protein n=1 Tax=Conidiobolus coronatus (strain ATCC 28846 / CBS 209.66 / NRRL 28638) TaxID=796925 RepID=A0A137P7B3_CONC2|nr:hypothetical protein CONCODRAFT_17304 [Conidiobolus coronatus NRRL 28638]|eukprot:KXN70892.1 hypothetical protein CONCODRAFT_17304 [Conidiobolus coronatus NRRL 28638]
MSSTQFSTSPTALYPADSRNYETYNNASYFKTMKFKRPPSISEENLFIKELPSHVSITDLNSIFKQFNFTRVYCFDNPINDVTHRIEFHNLKDVEKAYAILNNSLIKGLNVILKLSPDLENFNLFEQLPDYYIKVTNLHFAFNLYEIFRDFGPILNLVQISNEPDSAPGITVFIRYPQLQYVERAIESMDGKILFKSKISVSMASPNEIPDKYVKIENPKPISQASPSFRPTSQSPHAQPIPNANFMDTPQNPSFNPRRRQHVRHQSLYVGRTTRAPGFNDMDGSHTLDDLAAIRMKSIEKLQNSLNNNLARHSEQEDYQSSFQQNLRQNMMGSESYPEVTPFHIPLPEILKSSLKLAIENLDLIPAKDIDMVIDYLKQLGAKNIELLLKYPVVLKEKVLEAKALIIFNSVEIPPQLLIMQDCELFINKLNELNEEDQKEELGYKLYPILETLQVPNPSDVCTKLLDQMTSVQDMVYLMLRPDLLIPEINKLT